MALKNITYQRVLNLGDYNSKRLELSEEVFEGEDEEEAISRVMERVERKIREAKEIETVNRINSLETTANNLRQQISYLEEKLRELKSQEDDLTVFTGEEPSLDDIPFNNANQTTSTPDDF